MENGEERTSEFEEKKPKKRIWIFVLTHILTAILSAAIVLWLTNYSFTEFFVTRHIDKEYDGEISREAIKEAKISGIVAGLNDEHSFYIPKEVGYNSFDEEITGNYCGIGVQVLNDGGTFVIDKVFKDSPAIAAGVKEGDVIRQIDDTPVSEIEFADISSHIKGEEGTFVKIIFLRGTEKVELNIERKPIAAPSVEAKMLENNIGYVSLSQFDEDSDVELENAIDGLGNVSGLIIDLRDNPGGLFEVCLNSLNLFIDGKPLVTAKYKNDEETFTADKGAKYTMPLAVLVNDGSASSSEIFSACVQDNKRGTIVGTLTYGKGSIQRTIPLPENSGMNLTVGHFYSPNGKTINEVGVTPDVIVKNEKDSKTDLQLNSAIECLLK